MQIYLVGGAVRDELLGYPFKDKDYMVTGATIADMEQQGYQQVGKSFPVFLHPETHDEYALARTEKKHGSGYTGFVCDFAPTITIEEDLKRRDLTINAIAKDQQGNLVDPFGGQQDLNNRILRHVSDAFVEDPLRVLRVARFAARYNHLGFTIASETLDLMTEIAESGELQALVAERIWQEFASALSEQSPQVFFDVLHKVGALKALAPELHHLWGVPNPERWHPEIDTGIHTLMVIEQAAKLSSDLPVRFAALCHDLGKALTPADNWPHHHGHEKLGLEPIKDVCERLKVPNDCKELALLTSEFHTHCHKAFELKPTTVIKLFDQLDAWRKPQRFHQFLLTCFADFKGRTGFETKEYPQVDYLKQCFDHANAVQVQQVLEAGFKGAQIREQLSKLRAEAVKNLKNSHGWI